MINSGVLHLILLKTYSNFTKYYDKEKIKFVISLIIFTLTLNVHLNQIFAFIKYGHFNKILLLIVNNIAIIIYWIIIITLSIVFFEFISYTFKLRKIIKRKLYHFLALLIFIPGIKFMNRQLLLFICICVLYIFIMIEVLRSRFKNFPIFKKLSDYLISNIDERDNKKFILTHIFLLFGCFSSVILSEVDKGIQGFSYLGLVVLGIGDSMASIIGSKFGKIKIFPGTHKTLEGTLAAIISSLFFLCILDSSFYSFKTIIPLILVFVYEGYTLEIDNLVLPLFAYRVFKLLFLNISN